MQVLIENISPIWMDATTCGDNEPQHITIQTIVDYKIVSLRNRMDGRMTFEMSFNNLTEEYMIEAIKKSIRDL